MIVQISQDSRLSLTAAATGSWMCQLYCFVTALSSSNKSYFRTSGACVFPQLVPRILFLTCEKCHIGLYWASGHLAPICEDAHRLYRSNTTDLLLTNIRIRGYLLVIVADGVYKLYVDRVSHLDWKFPSPGRLKKNGKEKRKLLTMKW